MDNIELYIKFKKYIEKCCEDITLPSDINDVYELLFFIKDFLYRDYLVNMKEIFKLYGANFNINDYLKYSDVILQFVNDVKKI
jgi:hypothetical protein